ncbi:hypothetical protein E1212_22465 [Jiangella ureilytica]|uniref:Glycoside hydrolase family 127 protein n=1 Tax=Jiangella ureilytica TaxID=2530374 RepID=A0A4R4RFK8_9ACTN|nr:beta-L-arabinofuranosidase domain-containing protein [Jiangella ureilytica]TDC48040.1 hypothetical protein E1212_22465 [Jiangella ureilytica]
MTATTSGRPGSGPAAALTQLEPVGYTGAVTLHGRLGQRVAQAMETYGGLSDDDVLKGFRRAAGLPAPGNDLTGWAAETSAMTFGQWVSGLARLAAATGERGLAAKASGLIAGYAATLGAGHDPHLNIYAWEKLVCGFVDSAVYGGDAGALPLLSKIVRAERYDRTRAAAVANDFSGEEPDFTIEWYTLAENLYRGHWASGDDALATAAREWHYDAYWDRFRERPAPGRPWDIPAWLHAYSHVNTFASAAAAYEMHGDPGHLDILRNAYDWLTTTQTFATGGFGPHEFTMPQDGTLGRTLEWITDSAEITCGSWAAFKLCTALLRFTGEAHYVDWVEQLVYNGIGATVPVQPDGRTPYYADYRLGVATKLPYWNAWPCCSGTYVQAVAHLHDLVYFRSPDGLAVALYVPSEYSGEVGGARATIRQRTTFPEADDTVVEIALDRPAAFTLRLRVPGWAAMTISVNDEPVPVTAGGDEWFALARTWRDGDRVAVGLGPRLRALPVDEQHPNRVAMAYGPVVLAQDVDWVVPFDAPVPWSMLDWESHLVRQGSQLLFLPAEPGTHRMPPGPFRPFYEVPERRPYRIYHDLGSRRIV